MGCQTEINAIDVEIILSATHLLNYVQFSTTAFGSANTNGRPIYSNIIIIYFFYNWILLIYTNYTWTYNHFYHFFLTIVLVMGCPSPFGKSIQVLQYNRLRTTRIHDGRSFLVFYYTSAQFILYTRTVSSAGFFVTKKSRKGYKEISCSTLSPISKHFLLDKIILWYLIFVTFNNYVSNFIS